MSRRLAYFLGACCLCFRHVTALVWGITDPLPEALRAGNFNFTARDIAQAINEPVEIVAYSQEQELREALSNRSVDLVMTGSGLSACFQASNKIMPLATLYLGTASGGFTNQVAGIIFTNVNNTAVNTLDDIVGKTIAADQFSHLATFQAQWGVLESNGIRMFIDTGTVVFTYNSTEVVRTVREGLYDVGFTYASHLVYLQQMGKFRVSDFKILNAQGHNNFIYTTSTPLYPGVQLSATSKLSQRTSLNITNVFLAPKQDAALAARYTTVSAGFNVFVNLRLQAFLQIQLPPFTGCFNMEQWLARLKCPSGFRRVNSSCGDCPPSYTCVCKQCERRVPHVGRLSTAAFVITVALPVVFSVLCTSLCYRGRKLRVTAIPAKEVQETHQEATLSIGMFRDKLAVTTKIPSTPLLGWHLLGVKTCVIHLEHMVEKRANLQHPSLANCIGLCRISTRHSVQVFLGGDNGTLQQLLLNPSVDFDVQFMLRMLAALCDAFLYLHQKGHFGVDIRTHNILIGKNCALQCIADLTTETPQDVWQAPEVLNGEDPNYASDAYVLAMLIYEVLHRTEPFADRSTQDALAIIKDTTVMDRFRIEPEVARLHDLDILYDTMQDCWTSKPSQRPTITDVKHTIEQLQTIYTRRQVETGSYTGSSGQAVALQDENARAAHVQYVAVLYAQGPGIHLLFEKCANFEVATIPCATPGIFLGMALDLDSAKQIGQLAHLALANNADIQAAIHYGRVIKCLLPLEEPKFCMLGPGLPVTKYLQEAGKRRSVLVSSAAAEHLLGTIPPIGVLQKRPGVVEHRGFINISCYWLTV